MKVGDIVYIPYLAWGRNPTLTITTIVKAGPKQITTQRGGNTREQWTHEQVYTDEHTARAILRDRIQEKITEVREDLRRWEEKLATIEEQLK